MVATAKVRTRPPQDERPRRRPSIADHILDVAEELFARAGYAATTTRAIAARARVNVGQLHYYFESKRALFEAAARGENDLPIARLLAGASQPVTCFT